MFNLAKCTYDVCQLPDNNKRFILQGAYILIGILVLFSRPENFTFFQTMLFTFPILIDVVCCGPTNPVSLTIRWIVGVIDVLITIACVLGLDGIVVQTPTCFRFVESMLLFGGAEISKNFIAVLLFLNLMIPIAYYHYSPCKNSAKIRAALAAKREVKT